jgi:predicted FMN-binding regulatory protein PaiB
LKIRMMVGKKRNNQNRQARDRSGIAIHMMSWGDYICNLL